MECLKTQRRLIEVGIEDIPDYLEIYNECRRTWKVYFPLIRRENLELLISSLPDYCLYAVEQDGIRLGYLLGYLHNYFGDDCVRIAHHETIMVSKLRCKSGYTIYKVTEMLVDALIAWSKLMHAQRIVWSTGTGNYRGLEHILRIRNAEQIGIVLNMEL